MESVQCKVCGMDFRESSLSDGKCELCITMYPNCNSREEACGILPDEDIDMDATIKEVIDNRLLELGLVSECECGSLFYKRSPAHKRCKDCQKDN